METTTASGLESRAFLKKYVVKYLLIMRKQISGTETRHNPDINLNATLCANCEFTNGIPTIVESKGT